MAGRVNAVIAGDFVGGTVLFDGLNLVISGMMSAKETISKQTVTSYSLVDQVKPGLLSSVVYTVEVNFVSGKRSLICLSRELYDKLLRTLF